MFKKLGLIHHFEEWYVAIPQTQGKFKKTSNFYRFLSCQIFSHARGVAQSTQKLSDFISIAGGLQY